MKYSHLVYLAPQAIPPPPCLLWLPMWLTPTNTDALQLTFNRDTYEQRTMSKPMYEFLVSHIKNMSRHFLNGYEQLPPQQKHLLEIRDACFIQQVLS